MPEAVDVPKDLKKRLNAASFVHADLAKLLDDTEKIVNMLLAQKESMEIALENSKVELIRNLSEINQQKNSIELETRKAYQEAIDKRREADSYLVQANTKLTEAENEKRTASIHRDQAYKLLEENTKLNAELRDKQEKIKQVLSG